MKVEKINKFFKNVAKKIEPFIVRGLFALEALLQVGSIGASYGCAPTYAEASPTDAPTITQTTKPIPTSTPNQIPTLTPTQEPTPSPTPMPELTYEQKKLLLGINGIPGSMRIGELALFECTLNNQISRFCVSMHETKDASLKENGYAVRDYYSIYDEKEAYLFTVKVPTDPETHFTIVPIRGFIDYIVKVSPALQGMKPTYLVGLAEAGRYYKVKGIDFNDNETLTEWGEISQSKDNGEAEKLNKKIISLDELVKIFLDSTDQEKIKPFWEYIPGASVPDELKEFYPNAVTMPEDQNTPVTYIALTSALVGNPPVSYLEGRMDEDTAFELEHKYRRI